MLGAELREIRERRGISQPQAARHSGISLSALKAIESGERYPTLRTLEGLAECYGISVVIGPVETVIDSID